MLGRVSIDALPQEKTVFHSPDNQLTARRNRRFRIVVIAVKLRMIVAIHPADPIAAVLIHNKLLFYKLVACEYKTAIVSECLLQHAI